MNKLHGIVPGIFLLLLSAAVSAQPDRVSLENARHLAQEYLIADTHIDLPYRLLMNWEDVSQYPSLIFELLKRGYSDEQIRKICGGHLLRVWSVVEQVAAQKGRP